jgi:hypothetical protein
MFQSIVASVGLGYVSYRVGNSVNRHTVTTTPLCVVNYSYSG